ncbi:hypothetical protein GIB67_021183 [Kingdonia uniflora]|uniref:Uncharacterized protein n=1 Tax=Kingdonia uniflora TaxID=39325 RepID=A0A7J7LFF6_9MAGN|nr:hypothetical protein GIB67_021183 [Kingdonia uniflora]
MKYTGCLLEAIMRELKLFTVANIEDATVKVIFIEGKYLKNDKEDDKIKSGYKTRWKSSIRERPKERDLHPRSFIAIIISSGWSVHKNANGEDVMELILTETSQGDELTSPIGESFMLDSKSSIKEIRNDGKKIIMESSARSDKAKRGVVKKQMRDNKGRWTKLKTLSIFNVYAGRGHFRGDDWMSKVGSNSTFSVLTKRRMFELPLYSENTKPDYVTYLKILFDSFRIEPLQLMEFLRVEKHLKKQFSTLKDRDDNVFKTLLMS